MLTARFTHLMEQVDATIDPFVHVASRCQTPRAGRFGPPGL